MTEWDIQARSNACTACHTAFAEKQTYHTLLAMNADGYQRRDLCASCFAGIRRDGVISYWQGQYKLPPPPPPEPIRKDTAETLLRKLVKSSDPAHTGARYILAVMLERKKILRHRDTVHDENRNNILVYEHAQSGESFTVPDPHLRLDQLDEVQRRVAELLQPAQRPYGSAEAEPAADPASNASNS
jgi:hypothetical protein